MICFHVRTGSFSSAHIRAVRSASLIDIYSRDKKAALPKARGFNLSRISGQVALIFWLQPFIHQTDYMVECKEIRCTRRCSSTQHEGQLSVSFDTNFMEAALTLDGVKRMKSNFSPSWSLPSAAVPSQKVTVLVNGWMPGMGGISLSCKYICYECHPSNPYMSPNCDHAAWSSLAVLPPDIAGRTVCQL